MAMKIDATEEKQRHAYVVIDAKGNGWSKRHGKKETPSVYEHERNAETFIKRHANKKLRVVPCIITYQV